MAGKKVSSGVIVPKRNVCTIMSLISPYESHRS